jgi:hypothetical protein
MWTKASAVILDTSEQKSFLDDFAELLPFAPFVTSGTRSPEAQARAMYVKIQNAGFDGLSIYPTDFAESIYEAFPDVSAGASVVEAYRAQGRGSNHLRGLAVDIRTKDRTEGEIGAMIAATEQLGAKPLREYNPPHLHIGIPSGYGAGKKKARANILVPVVVVLALLWTSSR